MKKIIGISCFFHDSAASLIINGKIIAAAQEERFTRCKFDKRFPENAIKFCLKKGNCKASEIDAIVFYEKPYSKFERLLSSILIHSPFTFKKFLESMPEWINSKLHTKNLIKQYLLKIIPEWKGSFFFSEHHLSHASSAFYPSPFKESAVLVMDAVGEFACTSIHHGVENNLFPKFEQFFPHSIGMLYSAFTYYSGFKVNSGEYKLMGLAPYGSPKYYDTIMKNLIELKNDGSFKLDLSYFEFHKSLTMTSDKFHEKFGGPPRKQESKITKKDMDIAASIQKVIEEIIIKTVSFVKFTTNQKNLCMAGGVALNCVANGKILKEKIFKNIWIQPASGDAGGAVGAALAIYYQHYKYKRNINLPDGMSGSYLGPEFTDKEIKTSLVQSSAKFKFIEKKKLISKVALDLKAGKIVGWFNGKLEFGPRALGSRSILGNPKIKNMQKKMNLKIKYRESFRPFAPVVLEEKKKEYFNIDINSPYMNFVADVKENLKIKKNDKFMNALKRVNEVRSIIPAVTHVDYSSRIQTVNEKTNPLFYRLIKEFEKITGCSVLINTSFNIRGEPIVCSPWDAYRCFMGTNMDILILGSYYLEKKKQDNRVKYEYTNQFNLD